MKLIFTGYTHLSALCAMLVLCSCASGISQKSNSKVTAYSEELATYRPKVEKDTAAPATDVATAGTKSEPIAATRDVTAVLEKKLVEISQNAPASAKGYRVNIYSGTSRDEASVIKKQAEILCDAPVYIQFKTPNFRVKVGDAMNRLEANYLLGQLKTDFPGAVVVPDDIVINQKP